MPEVVIEPPPTVVAVPFDSPETPLALLTSVRLSVLAREPADAVLTAIDRLLVELPLEHEHNL